MADRIAAVDGPLVEGARAVEATAGRVKERLVNGTHERLASTKEYVVGNPMASVVAAVGLGAVIGYILGRRTS